MRKWHGIRKWSFQKMVSTYKLQPITGASKITLEKKKKKNSAEEHKHIDFVV